MKIVENICLEKKQVFANVSLSRKTVARRIEEISFDIKRQLEVKAEKNDLFRQPVMEALMHLALSNFFF